MNPDPQARRLTHREQLLFLLRDGQWHGMREMLTAGSVRYSARVLELRADGYRIEKRPLFGGVYEYRWVRGPGQIKLL